MTKGVSDQNVVLCCLRKMERVGFVSIPDSVEELCDLCFSRCSSLSRVTFGTSSSLKMIGKDAFSDSGLSEIHIPDSVEELCDLCFSRCSSLSRVTFGTSSSLKRIGPMTFCCSRLSSFSFPAGVVSVGGGLFSGCPLQHFVICDIASFFRVDTFLLLSQDRRFCYGCIGQVKEVIIPDSIEELCDSCFNWCSSLSRVTFGASSSLKRISKGAFSGSGLSEIHIPDSVAELLRHALSSRCRVIKLA